MDTTTTALFTANPALIAELKDLQSREGSNLRGTAPQQKSLALRFTGEMARLTNYPLEQAKLRAQVAEGPNNILSDFWKLFVAAVGLPASEAPASSAPKVYPPSAALVKLEEMQGSLRGYFADMFGTMKGYSLEIAALKQEIKDLKDLQIRGSCSVPAPKRRTRGPKAHEDTVTVA